MNFVIFPKKISAITSPVSFSPDSDMPGKLYAIVTAPIASGMCSVFDAASLSFGFSGASDAANTIVSDM